MITAPVRAARSDRTSTLRESHASPRFQHEPHEGAFVTPVTLGHSSTRTRRPEPRPPRSARFRPAERAGRGRGAARRRSASSSPGVEAAFGSDDHGPPVVRIASAGAERADGAAAAVGDDHDAGRGRRASARSATGVDRRAAGRAGDCAAASRATDAQPRRPRARPAPRPSARRSAAVRTGVIARDAELGAPRDDRRRARPPS